MTDSNKPVFYQHCNDIMKHYESCTKELESAQNEITDLKKSKDEAEKQAKFYYDVACKLNEDLHRYISDVKKIDIGLSKIKQRVPNEVIYEITSLIDYIKGHVCGDQYRNGGISNELDSHLETLHRINSHSSDRRGNSANLDNYTNDAGVEHKNQSNSPRVIKTEVVESPATTRKTKDENGSGNRRHREGEVSRIHEENQLSGAHSHTSEESLYTNEQLQHGEHMMPGGEGMAMPPYAVRPQFFDMQHGAARYYQFSEYAPPMFQPTGPGFFDMYGHQVQTMHPFQFYRPQYNMEAFGYRGNAADGAFPVPESYVEFANGSADMRHQMNSLDLRGDGRNVSGPKNNLKLAAVYDHDDPVCAVTLGPDNLAVSAAKGLIKLWDTRNRNKDKPLMNIECMPGKYIRSCKISELNRNLIVAGECDYMSVWDLESRNLNSGNRSPIKKADIMTSASACFSLMLANNGRLCYGGMNNGQIILWDLVSNQIVTTLSGHTDVVTCLDIASDDEYLFSGSLDFTVCKWDLRKNRLVNTTKNKSQVFSLAASSDSKWVTVGLENSILNIYPENSNKIELKVHTSSVLGMKMAPNNDWLLTVGKDAMINTIKMPRGPPIHRICEEGAILCCDMSSNIKYVITGSSHKKSTLYEVIL